MRSCKRREVEFTAVIISKLSDYLKKPVNEVYKILKDVETLGNYIIECYDVLHAFDKFLKGLSD